MEIMLKDLLNIFHCTSDYPFDYGHLQNVNNRFLLLTLLCLLFCFSFSLDNEFISVPVNLHFAFIVIPSHNILSMFGLPICTKFM